MKLLILFSLVALAIASPALNKKPESRVAGGAVVPADEYKFQVSIRLTSFHQCSGVIVDPYFVLTSASCVASQSEKLLSVYYGSHNRKDGGKEADVYRIHVHPNFTRSDLTNDLALLQVHDKLSGNTEVATLAFEYDRLNPGMYLWFSGWGYHGSDSGELSEQLHKAQSQAISTTDCVSRFSDIGIDVSGRLKLCVGDKHAAQSMCHGDLGGPAWFVEDEYPELPDRLYGISSFNFACGNDAKRPSVFTFIPPYVKWIQGLTKSAPAADAKAH